MEEEKEGSSNWVPGGDEWEENPERWQTEWNVTAEGSSAAQAPPGLAQQPEEEVCGFDLGAIDEGDPWIRIHKGKKVKEVRWADVLGEDEYESSDDSLGMPPLGEAQEEVTEIGGCEHHKPKWSHGRWQKFNWDSGAAQTVLPKEFAPEARPTGRKYKTASAELIEDYGELVLTGMNEKNALSRVRGRLAEVHKPLVAASKTAALGFDSFTDHEGGLLIPRSGPVAQGLRKELKRLLWIHGDRNCVPMWLEKGVYNFYLDMEANGKCGGHLSPAKDIASGEEMPGFPRRAQL
jgi:hypothetical protein